MDTFDDAMDSATGSAAGVYPVEIAIPAATENRNRLTTFFRFFLAIPHLILVGGPLAFAGFHWNDNGMNGWELGSGSGIIGLAACICALIAWFAIVFTGRHPDGLWKLGSYYLGWRLRAAAYMGLLRDEYPPFGEGAYPAELTLPRPDEPRDRVTVVLRLLLVLPHLLILAVLGLVWAFTTALAWIMIMITGRYPESLYGFAIGVLAWDIRVEAYLLLLRDEYPPFTLRA